MQASRDVFFLGADLDRPRWSVEQDKVYDKYASFCFYATGGRVTSLAGTLFTSYGNPYFVKISIPDNYPHRMPTVSLPQHRLERGCPHKFTNNNLCLMKPEQWSTLYSLAFVISKTAVWLNKYDYWKCYGVWPGNEQAH